MQKKEGESYKELEVRLKDKWMRDCESAEDVLERALVKQLLTTMAEELHVWVSEQKQCNQWTSNSGGVVTHILLSSILQEILTDQGSNFTSGRLEMYQLLRA